MPRHPPVAPFSPGPHANSLRFAHKRKGGSDCFARLSTPGRAPAWGYRLLLRQSALWITSRISLRAHPPVTAWKPNAVWTRFNAFRRLRRFAELCGDLPPVCGDLPPFCGGTFLKPILELEEQFCQNHVLPVPNFGRSTLQRPGQLPRIDHPHDRIFRVVAEQGRDFRSIQDRLVRRINEPLNPSCCHSWPRWAFPRVRPRVRPRRRRPVRSVRRAPRQRVCSSPRSSSAGSAVA